MLCLSVNVDFVEHLPVNYYNNFHVKVFAVLSWRHVMIATPYLGVAGVMMVQELAWDNVWMEEITVLLPHLQMLPLVNAQRTDGTS